MRRIRQSTDGFENGRGRKPRNAGVLLKVEKVRHILPCSLQREHSSADFLILGQRDTFGTPGLQNCEMINLCYVKVQSLWYSQILGTDVKVEL